MAIAGVGFLGTVAALARVLADSIQADKFTDANMLTFIRDKWGEVISDINRINQARIYARVPIVVVANQREYVLPPTVGKFIGWSKRDMDDNYEWEERPRHLLSPGGPRFTIEGPMLRLDPIWQSGETLELFFEPSGISPPFECAVTATASAGQLKAHTSGSELIAGSVSTEANAYLGYVLRVLTVSVTAANDVRQQRVIKSQQNVRTAADIGSLLFSPDLSPAPTDSVDTVTYEVLPHGDYRFENLVTLKVARFMSSVVGEVKRAATLQAEYKDALRAFRLDQSNANVRTGKAFHRITRGRRRLGKTG